ncbi:CDK9 kinase-activating protein cyclin T [Handroanthus impetiginosus]|uniref:CDK9 kinase-activating protein cyclin T n=1 Tax=Handroanthus impetiginosus TaxID=429701 RepID=A0A2G9H8U1_9LAMI|nr:CDK9 kinase-activating protein cyclin T [Handroanthus impetiginosus]
MSVVRSYQSRGGHFRRDGRPSYGRNSNMGINTTAAASSYNYNPDNSAYNTNRGTSNYDSYRGFSQNYRLEGPNYDRHQPDVLLYSKRRKISASSCERTGRQYQHQYTYPNDLVNYADRCEPPKYYNAYSDARLVCNSSAVVDETRCNDASAYVSNTSKRDRSKFEDEEVVFMTRDEIERCSPSRKDGIDPLQEAHLRYSYCTFLQSLGVRLDLPQTTIGTAMVLCHRFFLCRSHASHDRFLIATAVLFLASKSEETPRALNDVLRMSCETLHKQDFTFLSYMLPIDWFERYRERILEAEQLILTTLNFELNVQHPYESLTSTLQKLGFSQSVLVNLALNLVSEGLRSSLWLQFKPHQIAAGAAYLAAKFLNMNLASCHYVWHEFHTPPFVLKDIAHQLMELF